ncbi:MAG: hypothetical protein JWM11_1612 [Planctomycetaceae bacterium]|nr:hypothetical protein [Planctomycetaceae bacterium]
MHPQDQYLGHPNASLSRRQMLGSLGAGFGTLALADLLRAEEANAAAGHATHHTPKAKHVIFLFMSGGPSHIDLFDSKPSLKQYAGQRPAAADLRTERVTKGLLPSPFEFHAGGQSGLLISDLLPRIRDCADDLCIVKSMVGGNPNHAPAANHLLSGRIDQIHPSLGAWVSYGLGTANRNLPSFVSLSDGGTASRYVRNGYLPGEYQGTPINTAEKDPEKMVRYLRNGTLDRIQQERQLEFIVRQNRRQLAAVGTDPALEARIQAMETAFRMQFAAGEVFDVRNETQATQDEYGNNSFARSCLISRRLVERGVRYVHVELGGWDHHDNIDKSIASLSRQIDQPIAALLQDLKRRGLLAETLVVWGGEFGRTPVSESGNGRDHNHYGFTMWLAGGGTKGGLTYGATDEFGFRAVENRVSVHDLHATMLHLLGFDHERLTYRYSGRDFRLTDIHGQVVRELLA